MENQEIVKEDSKFSKAEKEEELQEKVEAVLFIAGKFLKLSELVMLTDINPIMLKEILKRIERKYSKGAIRVVCRNDSWKMDVAEKYYFLVNKIATGTSEFTKAEKETLAVIAYKEPVKQSVVIKIRGNKAYEHIKKFIECGLVNAKKSGRTKELTLSEEFDKYFSLSKKKTGGE